MQKINWFRRLFMSWTNLNNLITKEFEQERHENQKQIIVLETKLQNIEERLAESKAFIDKFNQIITLKDQEISQLKENQIKDYQKLENNKQSNLELQNEINRFKIKEKELIIQLNQIEKQKQDLDQKVNQKLSTLNRIEKTFFGISGNKGKGELGELQLKNILERSGITSEFWVENLLVGRKTVEFAIKSGQKDKWIPVDSKVLEPNFDDDKKPIIDKNYENNVLKQVREVTKYLAKKNTVSYGLLVLQNDEVYFKLYEANPNLFSQSIRDYKIYITSPSLFVQFAFSISHIVDIYNKVQGEEEVYKEIINTLKHVQNFGNSVKNAYDKLKVSFERHYPLIEKSYNKARTLDQSDKLKELSFLSDNNIDEN